MAETSIRSGAVPDFPFAELSPSDFHRLVLHLLEREPRVARVESYGALGSDGGVDLIASMSAADGAPPAPAKDAAEIDEVDARYRPTLVQVKRAKAFNISAARAELRRLRASGSHVGFERYLLVAACVPSAAAIDELRRGCAELGLHDVEVWERSALTARVLRHRDLLSFFDIPAPREWLEDGGVARGMLDLRRLVFAGHPVVLLVGERWREDLELELLSTDAPRSEEPLRWLVTHHVITSAIGHGTDLSLALSDLLAVSSGDDPPAGELGLWQPRRDLSIGPALADVLGRVAARHGHAPLLIALGLTAEQVEELRVHAARLRDHVAERGMVVLDDSSGELCATDLRPLSGAELLWSLHRCVAPDWLAFHCRPVDFADDYGFEDVIAGRSVSAGIVRNGHWPMGEQGIRRDRHGSVVDELGLVVFGRPTTIEDLPGTGKTASAYRMAHLLCPEASCYLDLQAVSNVTLEDLTRLVFALEGRHERVALILDNAQTAKASQELAVLLDRRKDNRVHLIRVVTLPFEDLDLLGGELQQTGESRLRRATSIASLAKWVAQHPEVDAERVHEAESRARNMWHFFYLLRGGAASLLSELEDTARSERSDVVWYAVAAAHVFLGRPATVRTIHGLIAEQGLWPFSVSEGERGRWILSSVVSLLSSRRIVAAVDGLLCRHSYEAYGVVRLSHDRGLHISATTYREANVALFKRALAPIGIPPEMRDRSPLTKRDLYQFTDDHVMPVLEHQRELERAVPFEEELRDHVETTWRELMELLEEWPANVVYWLFNRAHFSSFALRFSPFSGLLRLRCLESVGCESDAIDLEYMIKGVIAYEALATARGRWEMGEAVHTAERDLADLATRRERLQALPVGSKVRSATDAALEKVEQSIVKRRESARATIDMLDEVNRMPPEFTFGEETVSSLTKSTRWLEHHTSLLAQAVESVDQRRLLASMRNLKTARPLLLAHLWLLSPELGRQLFAAMSSEWREEVVRQVKAAPDSYSALHLGADDDALAVFASELAEVSPEIHSWIAQGGGGKLGKRVRAANGSGIRGAYPAPALPRSPPERMLGRVKSLLGRGAT
ncbi:MAG TPA: hypothetical protein VNY52_06710 [Solirubrobacteraceae bacterium]|jgi:hypothetical protein|nr:hypothetical protein [Solirubrobacteraceae bacterium]